MNDLIIINVKKKSKKTVKIQYVTTDIDENELTENSDKNIQNHSTSINSYFDNSSHQAPIIKSNIELEIKKNNKIKIQNENEIENENENENMIGLVLTFSKDYKKKNNLKFKYYSKFQNLLLYNDEIFCINNPHKYNEPDFKKNIYAYILDNYGILSNDVANCFCVKIKSNVICVVNLNNIKPLIKYKNELIVSANNKKCFYIKTYIILIPYNSSSDTFYNFIKNRYYIKHKKTVIDLADIVYSLETNILKTSL